MEKREIEFDQAKMLKLFAEGSEYAFTQIYERYQDRVFVTAFSILKDRELANDIVQEIFLQVWNRRIAFAQVSNLEAFIYTMAKNLTLTYLRDRSTEIAASYQYSQTRNLVDNSIGNNVMEQDYELILNQTLEQLPLQQRRVYQLSRVEGLKHEAIAMQLKISDSTVNNLLTTALKSIRRRLKPHIGLMIIAIIDSTDRLF